MTLRRHPLHTPGMQPSIQQKALKLSRKVDECKPLHQGQVQRRARDAQAVVPTVRRWAGLTLVHFSAQLERFVWDGGCA